MTDAAGVRSTVDPLSYLLWFFVAHALSVMITAPGLRGRSVIVAGAIVLQIG